MACSHCVIEIIIDMNIKTQVYLQNIIRKSIKLLQNQFQAVMDKYAFIMEKPEREFKRNNHDDSKDKKLTFRQILAFNLIFSALLALSALIFKLEKMFSIKFY